MSYFQHNKGWWTLVLLLVSLPLALTAGCATTAKYEKVLNSWINTDINRLIESWGPPSDQLTMPDGRTLYTWLWVGDTVVTSNYNRYLNLATAYATTYWCKTTFTVDAQGIIRAWRFEGNACVSR